MGCGLPHEGPGPRLDRRRAKPPSRQFRSQNLRHSRAFVTITPFDWNDVFEAFVHRM